jgi:hypothetical protein
MPSQLQLGIDRSAELDAEIECLLRQDGHWPLGRWEREVLALLVSHKGRERAIPSPQIIFLLGLPRGEAGRRIVTESVQSLIVNRYVPIGAGRGDFRGYFLIVTPEDQQHAAKTLRGEFFALLRRLRVLLGKRECARLFGQIQLELDAEGTTDDPSVRRGGLRVMVRESNHEHR